MTHLLHVQNIDQRVLGLRGQRVMLDTDLAEIYGVTTSRLNEQVKRNLDRFPDDFMFQLSPPEKAEVIAKCDHLRQLRFSRTLPFAFTEHGALMLASVLNSTVATRASIEIVRVFIRLREAMANHRNLATELDALERKCDRQFKVVFNAIRELMNPPRRPKRTIGFRTRRTR